VGKGEREEGPFHHNGIQCRKNILKKGMFYLSKKGTGDPTCKSSKVVRERLSRREHKGASCPRRRGRGVPKGKEVRPYHVLVASGIKTEERKRPFKPRVPLHEKEEKGGTDKAGPFVLAKTEKGQTTGLVK